MKGATIVALNVFMRGMVVGITITVLGVVAGCQTTPVTTQAAPSGRLGDHRIDHVVIVAIDGLRQDTLLGYLQRSPGTRPGGLHDVLGVQATADGLVLTKATAVQQAVTVFPSFTYPSWVSMFTGLYPAAHGITGNNVFFRDRAIARYYTEYHVDAARVQLDKDFLGKDMNRHIPTVHELVEAHGGKSVVVHNMVTRGAEAHKPDFDTLWNYQSNRSAAVDDNALWEAVHTLSARREQPGSPGPTLPVLFTLYFSGLDHMEHIGREHPEEARLAYLSHVDTLLSQFFDGHPAITRHRYTKRGEQSVRTDPQAWPGVMHLPEWAHTVVIFVSDHGHAPVRWEEALGIEDLKVVFEELSEPTGRAYRVEDPSLVTENPWSKLRALWGFVEEGRVSRHANIVATFNGGALGLHIKRRDASWAQRPDYVGDVKPVLEAMLLTMHHNQYDPQAVLYYQAGRYVVLPYSFAHDTVTLAAPISVAESALAAPQFPNAVGRVEGAGARMPGDPDTAPDLIFLADRTRQRTYGNKRDWRVLEGLRVEHHRHFHSDHGHLQAEESVVPLIFAFGHDSGERPHPTICHASIVDVAPTVLDLLGLLPTYEQTYTSRPAPLIGHSLTGALDGVAETSPAVGNICRPHLTVDPHEDKFGGQPQRPDR